MENTFKVGDQVELISGGPVMTVQRVVSRSPMGVMVDDDDTGHIRCQWFSGKKLEAGNFPAGSLKRVQPKGE